MEKQVKKNKVDLKNSKVLLIIVIAVLLVSIVAATFAYFIGSSSVSNTLNITTRIENNNGTFVAQGANIELNVTRSLMQESNSNEENAIVENNGLLNIEYLSGTNDRIICKYDINYEWVSEEDNQHTYTITNNNKKEFTYEIYDESNVPIITNNEVNSEANFTSSNDRTKHNLKTLYISNASTDTPTHQEYRIEAKFYNLEEDQNNNADKNWRLQFYVDNIVCGIRSDVVYDIISGDGVELIKGDNESLEIRIDADYSKFENGGKVYIDGDLVDPSNYTSRSGSTVISFLPGFIDNLDMGDHTGEIGFNDGGISEFIFRLDAPTVTIAEPITNDIYVGDELQLTATTNSRTQTITWESDDTSVATVDSNGLVTGVSVDVANIKAKIGSIESAPVAINVKTNTYNVNITDQNNKGETLGTRTETCTIGESTTITSKDGGYTGYPTANSETITCMETNNVTLTYSPGTYDINITDTSSNGTLGTRTETCTYGESTLVPVGSYTGYSSPEEESITCDVTNSKTYTYTQTAFTITVTDKTTGGETLGTRNIQCTYGETTTVNAGTYTGYTSPASTSTVCGLSNSATNNLEMTYTPGTYDVAITDVSSNGGTLGTRTESCTYGASYTPTVTSYTGHSAPSTSSITCGTSNSKTYTYTANTYSVTIKDKKPNGTVLGTRSDTCTYGQSYTPTKATNGTYTGYNAPSSVSSITCSSSNTVNITYVARTDMPVTINYKNTSGTTIYSSGSTTCTYDSSKTVSPRTISGYTSPSSQTFTCGSSNTVNFTYTVAGTPSNTKIQSLAGTTSGIGSVINQTIGSYTNTIYIGKKPNNYVEFNEELWRIIGVYNEDTHGLSGQSLIKIIKNDNLRSESETQTMPFDCKQSGLGSSQYNTGSNEWSDSQLMFLLNGPTAINKGKLYNGNAMSTYTTQVRGNYIQDRNYRNIFRIDKGSYLTTNRETNKTVYVPADATTSTLTETTGTLASTLSSTAQNMVQEVVWHLGELDERYNSSASWTYSYGITSHFYEAERGTDVSSLNSKSATWEGKIGLMYPSDYGYATSGGDTYDRNSCLEISLNIWNTSYLNKTNCAYNSWLLYINSTSSSEGIGAAQWSISNYLSGGDSVYSISDVVWHNYPNMLNVVRPTVYLKSNVKITSGDGSYDNPYQLSM